VKGHDFSRQMPPHRCTKGDDGVNQSSQVKAHEAEILKMAAPASLVRRLISRQYVILRMPKSIQK
jgi:hypothetical protein